MNISDGMYQRAVALAKENPRIGRVKIARELGVGDYAASQIVRMLKGEGLQSHDLPDEFKDSFEEIHDDDTIQLRTVSKHIVSLEMAMDYFDVDLDIWRVQKYIVNQWGKGNHTQVKVWLERRMTQLEEDVLRQFADQIIEPAPAPRRVMAQDASMLVMSLVDHHFGKLAWAQETGETYDLKVAEALYSKAVDVTMERARPYGVSRVVLPIGNDFFHFDTSRGTTANGTQMDVDTRPAKVFVAGFNAVVNAIHRILLSGCTAHVVYVPGNHDPTWGHHVCVAIAAYFRNDPCVTVDFSACPDKLVEYKGNLIYFTHLDVSQKNMTQLPAQIATMHPEAWARAHTREIHGGHFHHRKDTSFNATTEYTGTLVRILPSLCATDHWHFTRGFKGNTRATVSFLYSEDGLEGSIYVPARRLLDATP